MPEPTLILIALVVVALLVGIVLGWFVRGKRALSEKTAINAGWQEQLEAQRIEHDRLLDQNKSLMQQNNQYQASNKDAKMRASELSGALKEAFERRDELQRQIKEIRGHLEVAVAERQQLQHRASQSKVSASAMKERDDKIFRLSRQLESWRDRLPPLIELYKQRNEDASRLEAELAEAQERIDEMESAANTDEPPAESVDALSTGNDLEASNEPIETATGHHNAVAPDNLKKIKGVGPAIEKTLNELGIFRFDQIAQMSEYDIDRVARRLKGFRSRIYREDWIGQARALQFRNASG